MPRRRASSCLSRPSVCAALATLLWLGALLQPAHAQSRGEADRRFAAAQTLLADGRFQAGLTSLETLRRAFPHYAKRPAIDTRIALLQSVGARDEGLVPFLDALDLRDAGRSSEAIAMLNDLRAAAPASVLLDDARYLLAYLLIMDRYDFAAAREQLAPLLTTADSPYHDSARYLDAIALEQLGETERARDAFVALRDRHTAVVLPFGFRWPQGSVLSRYWFERADRRLAILARQTRRSSRLSDPVYDVDGSLSITVTVSGIDLPLVLVPSTLTETTDWYDGRMQGQEPPDFGVYTGYVTGDEQSWVRVVIGDSWISGVAQAHGEWYRLQSDSLVGTLDYYQPRRMPPASPVWAGEDLAARLHRDTLLAPPPREAPLERRNTGAQSDIQRIPMSVVIDSQFDRYYAGAGLAQALSHLNVADGLYREYELALSLDKAIVYTRDDEDPMVLGAVPLESSLRKFREFRLSRAGEFAGSAVAYLFTGNPKTDVTLGLAWIDTLCRTDGYDVGVTTPTTIGDLLLAHELGHSFGATHDSDTTCSAETHRLMWPEVSSQTAPEFTRCSSDAIRKAHERVCLHDGVDLELDIIATDDAMRFVASHGDSRLSVDAELSIESSVPSAFLWPASCLPQTPGSAQCRLAAIRPGERRELTVPFGVGASAQLFATSAYLNSLGPQEVSPANNRGSRVHAPDDTGGEQFAGAPPTGAAAGGGGSVSLLLICLAISAGRRARRPDVRRA